MPLRGQMPPPGYGQSLCVCVLAYFCCGVVGRVVRTRLTVCIPRLLHRYKNKLILFGGTCGSFFYNHLFEYDTVEQVR